jgi:hypothetical protein
VTPWPTFQRRFGERWRAAASRGEGEHITVIAPTGFGKTHLALALLELRQYVLVLTTKRRDPLVEQLAQDGYKVVADPREILWTGDRKEPVTPRVVYWPRFPDKTSAEQRTRLLAREMEETLDWADRTGRWTLLIDETMFVHDQLRLEKSLNMLWYQARTQGVSVVALAQRPARVPRLAFSQASYLFLGRFGDKRDLETLRDLNSTIPREIVENTVRSLSKERHEFLFIDTARDELEIVIAPPR